MKNTQPPEPSRVVRGDCLGAERGGVRTLTSVFIPPRCQVRGEGRVKPPQSLNIGAFYVRGCSKNEVKKGEIGKMFLRRRLDVCALSKTKLKGRGEVMFGEVVGRVSCVAEGRVIEGVALLLSEWLLRCVVEWKEVSYRLMWVRVKIERESWVFISTYGPGSERSEKDRRLLE